ncbi:MAG: lactate utilization protein [Planctomycetota bacterium]
MQRDEFMARVKQATAAGRAYQVALNPLATAEQSYVGGGVDPVACFLNEWQLVGGFGQRVPNSAGVFEYLSDVLARHTVRTALMWRHPVLEALGLEGWLQSRGIEVLVWDEMERLPADERREKTFAADFGITGVDWAVAETGSLAVCSRPGSRGRSVSLLPPLHAAILTPSQIVPDLFDLFRLLGVEHQEQGLPSNVTLITGPSKTGDIQLKLTTGVHGPGEVHAIVLEG